MRYRKRQTGLLPAASVALVVSLLFMRCDGEVPLTAPEGAEISMSANPAAIPAEDGVSTITVVGFRSPEDGGGALADGTQIFFTTDLGVIEERVAMENGIARAFLRSTGRSGTATVNARSGSGIAAESVTVEIGASGDVVVTVTANPATLGPADFTSEIVATVTDATGNPIPNAPVIFETDAGALASQGSVLRTNANGQAFDRLTLLDDQGSATVTAVSGSASDSVTVNRGTFDVPLIDSVSPTSGARGSNVTLTITGQNFQPGATVSLGDGVGIMDVIFVNSETLRAIVHVDANAAGGARSVTVTNPDGGSGSLASAFSVGNAAPACAFDVEPVVGGTGTAADPLLLNSTLASFDASQSVDPDGTIASYDWDLGDGTSMTGVAFSHDYTPTTASGDLLQVALTVTDDEGDSCTLTRFVEVP